MRFSHSGKQNAAFHKVKTNMLILSLLPIYTREINLCAHK